LRQTETCVIKLLAILQSDLGNLEQAIGLLTKFSFTKLIQLLLI
uniref:FH2 domain-containing protein n=1 Tax=Brugia timori TaxID=42155 RepID=A0A0R3QRL3_9BILA